jgi:hypothetical protein
MARVFRALAALALAAAAADVAVAQNPPGPAGPPPGRGAAPADPAPSPAAVERAAQILAETRKALGGPALEAVTSVVATGRTRRVRGDNLVPIEFEIAIQLPDKYVRKDEVPAEESAPTSTGFNGADVIQLPVPPPPRAGGPGAVPAGRPGGPAPTPKQVAAMRQKAQATPIEYRFYYADYRDVNGVKFPFRLRRAIGPDTTEETTFDRFRLNTQIDPRKFAK